MFLAALPFGVRVGWGGQARDDHAVPFGLALRKLWPQTLLGWGVIVTLALTAPAAIPVALLVAGGLAFAIPLAVLTADPAIGGGAAARRPRAAAGRDRGVAARRARPAGVGAHRASAATVRTGARHARSGEGRRAASSVRCASITATAAAAAPSTRLYARYVARGDLVFDIGGHVGDRVASFRRLGARVVVAEPQPALAKTLRLLFGRDRAVIVEEAAVGRHAGHRRAAAQPRQSDGVDRLGRLHRRRPRRAGLGRAAMDAHHRGADDDARRARSRATAAPRFIKIDVEGLEAEVLAGLSSAVPALSFEFTTIQRDVALGLHRALRRDRLPRLPRFARRKPRLRPRPRADATEVARWLSDLPVEANSGDIYATLD